jgi:hypothetical protein
VPASVRRGLGSLGAGALFTSLTAQLGALVPPLTALLRGGHPEQSGLHDGLASLGSLETTVTDGWRDAAESPSKVRQLEPGMS